MTNGLEEVVNAGVKHVNIVSLTESLKKDPTNLENLAHLTKYIQSRSGLPSEEVGRMINKARKDVYYFREIIEGYQEEDEEGLVKCVSDNYQHVIDGLNEGQIEQLVATIPDADKKYLQVMKKLEEGDFDGVRDAYAETFEDSGWKRFIQLSDEGFIKKYAARYVSIQQTRFLQEKGLVEETEQEDGTKVLRINQNKAREYISKQGVGLESEDKKQTYLKLGDYLALDYLRQRAREQQQATLQQPAQAA